MAMSNHHHTVFFDRHGNFPAFIHRFHELFAKCQNALRGRWENFWSATEPGVVHLVDREDVIRKLVYTATNPVNDHLVARVHHWPGVNGYVALRRGGLITAHRPAHFFRKCGTMPEEVELTLTIPAELGLYDDVVREVCRRTDEVEAAQATERARSGARVLGRRAVLELPWRAAPDSFEPRRTLNPRVAAANRSHRVNALHRQGEFLVRYRTARRLWLAGFPATFPAGTYWLRFNAHVETEPIEPGRMQPFME